MPLVVRGTLSPLLPFGLTLQGQLPYLQQVPPDTEKRGSEADRVAPVTMNALEIVLQEYNSQWLGKSVSLKHFNKLPFLPWGCFHRHDAVLIVSLFSRSQALPWLYLPAQELALVEVSRGPSLNFAVFCDEQGRVTPTCTALLTRDYTGLFLYYSDPRSFVFIFTPSSGCPQCELHSKWKRRTQFPLSCCQWVAPLCPRKSQGYGRAGFYRIAELWGNGWFCFISTNSPRSCINHVEGLTLICNEAEPLLSWLKCSAS